MKAIVADMKSGAVSTVDVPGPELRAGGVLIRTAFSVISSGTERTTIEAGKRSLLGKAMSRPDLVRQVVDYARTNGLKAAYQKVQSRLETLSPLGYSCSGVVLAVGDGVDEFRPGDRVACGGVGYASHSEVNFVPKNLVVRVPDEVPLDAAALTTIGAIATQGLRQANVVFGETVAIIGAGLLGIIATQIARAAGCRVVAIDANSDRAQEAIKFGANVAFSTDDPALQQRVADFSRYGVDAAIVTASSQSAAPVELAANLLRDRGRISVVGAVGLGVSRNLMYNKELSLTLSRSYGPGRYDPSYEEEGRDYPIGHVRWTERRNMEAFLDLIASGTLDLAPLLAARFQVDSGHDAYEQLSNPRVLTALIDYGVPDNRTETPAPVLAAKPISAPGKVSIGCIGAGSFARSVIFPNLQSVRDAHLVSVASTSGATSVSAQRGFGFHRAQSPAELLTDPEVSSVFVLTRHDSHARFVVEAISRGKAVFVEKPLAISPEELDQVCRAEAAAHQAGRSPFVMVGFNRRFAPATEMLCEFFRCRREPMALNIRINAGFIPREHWTQQDAGAGRIVGEFCHFLDWARAVVGVPVVRLLATALPDGARYNRDNFSVNAVYADGSVANLLYLANGDRAIHKESYEVFCEGSTARLNDFRDLELARNGKLTRKNCGRDKGHRRELELTIGAIKSGQRSPIFFSELVEVTRTTFAVHDSLNSGLPVFLTAQAAAAAD